MNDNVEAIPLEVRKLLYEYSGSTSGEFKGFILFACDKNGKVHKYESGEGVVFDGLIQNARNMIAEYDANCCSIGDYFSEFEDE